MEYTVLALDLDGTLTNTQKEVTPYTKEVIWKAIDQGVTVVLASGRPTKGVEPVAKELELEKRGGFILSYNGGQIVNCKTKEVVSAKLLPEEYYSVITEAAHKYQVEPLSYDAVGVLAETKDNPYIQKESQINKIPIHVVDNVAEAIEEPVTKMMIVGDHEKLLPVHAYLHANYEGHFEAFFSEGFFLEITPCGIEKASALETLLQHLGTTREHLMACGDGFNDIPMLEYAGFAVAMENAVEEAKEHAAYITGSNDEDGVAKAVEQFILKTR